MSITLIGVGIDTARYGHHVSFLGVDKRKALPGFHFKESTEGYALLVSALDRAMLGSNSSAALDQSPKPG